MPWVWQARGTGPEYVLPVVVTARRDRIQAPGRLTAAVTLTWLTLIMRLLIFAGVIGPILVSGVIRCGLIQFGQAIWTKAKLPTVTAMAGRVLRISTPTVTPRANANAA